MPTRQTTAPPPPPPPTPVQAQPYPAAMAQPRQPGLFGQMAATAAGVAVGHSVGHAVTVSLPAFYLIVCSFVCFIHGLVTYLIQ